MLTDWANYFCLGPVSKAYSAVDMHARRRLRRWLCDKHNEPRPGYLRFPEASLHSVFGLVQLPHRTASLPWQNYATPDCGDEANAESHAHRETTVTAPVLDSTRHRTHDWVVGVIVRFHQQSGQSLWNVVGDRPTPVKMTANIVNKVTPPARIGSSVIWDVGEGID